jgi:hypothetical protein
MFYRKIRPDGRSLGKMKSKPSHLSLLCVSVIPPLYSEMGAVEGKVKAKWYLYIYTLFDMQHPLYDQFIVTGNV